MGNFIKQSSEQKLLAKLRQVFETATEKYKREQSDFDFTFEDFVDQFNEKDEFTGRLFEFLIKDTAQKHSSQGKRVTRDSSPLISLLRETTEPANPLEAPSIASYLFPNPIDAIDELGIENSHTTTSIPYQSTLTWPPVFSESHSISGYERISHTNPDNVAQGFPLLSGIEADNSSRHSSRRPRTHASHSEPYSTSRLSRTHCPE